MLAIGARCRAVHDSSTTLHTFCGSGALCIFTGCLRARPAPPEGDEPPSGGCPFGLTDHGAPELRLNAMRGLAVWAKKTEHAERALKHGRMNLVSLPRRHSRHLESPRRSGAFSTIEPFDDVHVIVPSPSGDSVTTDLLVSTACSDPPAILTSKTPPALPAER
jgi:hypothetical protein